MAKFGREEMEGVDESIERDDGSQRSCTPCESNEDATAVQTAGGKFWCKRRISAELHADG